MIPRFLTESVTFIKKENRRRRRVIGKHRRANQNFHFELVNLRYLVDIQGDMLSRQLGILQSGPYERF